MLTTEKILDTAEEVLHKFGPKKANVVDVARALNVSHGTVYRHFESKAALHDAITKRWLERVTLPLIEITNSEENAEIRLKSWFEKLVEIKQEKAKNDPEMFASYMLLAKNLPEHVIQEHLSLLISQVESILSDGVDEKCFFLDNCSETAHAVFSATLRFHHPLHAHEWHFDTIKRDFENVYALLEKALKTS